MFSSLYELEAGACKEIVRPTDILTQLNSWPWKWKCSLLSGVPLLVILGLKIAKLLCPWDSPGKNTEVGYRSFLQEIFLT